MIAVRVLGHLMRRRASAKFVLGAVALVIVASAIAAGCHRAETIVLEFAPDYSGPVVVIFSAPGAPGALPRRHVVPESGVVIIKHKRPDLLSIQACDHIDHSHCRAISDSIIVDWHVSESTKYRENKPLVSLSYDSFVLKRKGTKGPRVSRQFLAADAIEKAMSQTLLEFR